MTKLDLYSLFYQVGKAGSFSKAAKELFITQSAISQGIKKLEDELNVTLFWRGSKGISLTHEGEVLMSHISPAMDKIAEGERELRKMSTLESGRLIIGAGDTISKHYLLPYLEIFHHKCPEIKIEVINRTSASVIKLLHEGRVDIGFVSSKTDSPGITFKKCLDAHDTFVASENHFPELKGKTFSLKEISKLPLLMLEDHSAGRVYVNEFFKSNGVTLKPDIELGSHDLLVSFAKAGLGIAGVTEEFCSMEGLFKLDMPPIPKRDICVAYLGSCPPPLAALRFIELIENKKI